MNRDEMWGRASERGVLWDLIVIGGGATGVGVAVDAASRGYSVVLFEQSDFGKGTSSRSTKLIHGGVRYLRQGDVPLVMDALRERGILRQNAPHLVRDREFVVPNYDWWEAPFYGIGLKVYDVLAGKYGFGPSKLLSKEKTIERIPTIETKGLRGGVVYHDGQFDDARLLIDLARTAAEQGGVLVNYAQVTGLEKDAAGYLDGVRVRDLESGSEVEVKARAVINATGAFTDGVLRMDEPDSPSIIRPSQGVHVVLDKAFLPGEAAIMVPQTDDGRVLFAVPWHDRVVVGTTDTPIPEATLEPRALDEEVEFILRHAALYLTRDPAPEDVLSVFAGIRPLVAGGEGGDTASLSRDHTLKISRSGLVTITGGKWTTYRKMAEDTVDHAVPVAGIEHRPSGTRELRIHGYHTHAERFGPLADHGSDAPEVEALIRSKEGYDAPIHERLPYRMGEVAWSVREEMARTVDDVLARRTRALLLDARAAIEAAPGVATTMADVLGRESEWVENEIQTFISLARGYLL